MRHKTVLFIFIVIQYFYSFSKAQVLGSNFLSALRGYGSDTCRFVSCPLGQYCMNGACMSSPMGFMNGLGGLGSLGGLGGGIISSKLCAETVDCYSGQVCRAGRCTFNNYLGVGDLGLGTTGALAALDPTANIGSTYYSGSSIMPYNSYNRMTSLIDRPSGVQMCSLMQECFNGQVCVNGYCSQSNVAYGGSQGFKSHTTCATGAVCPIGQYCMAGICIQSPFSQTSACSLGSFCPNGMTCQFGRCQMGQMGMYYGKRKKK